ncbi:MAG: DinB family protein, partial [candidate division Zixibacteria bacterium]|nr:DinB family protein [candidate division Zixibacteria bacterium]
LIQHQIHHRGQMTVLMRQAGIKVPSLYGPAKEDWAQMGLEPPEV